MARYRKPERVTRVISGSDEYVDFKKIDEEPTDKLDPNLGIIKSMPKLEPEEINDTLLRQTNLRSFKPGLSAVNDLDNESTPVVLAFGGINTARPDEYLNSSSVFVYHPDRNKWNFYTTMMEPRTYHAVGYFHRRVYVFGGYNPLHCRKGKMQATATTFQLTVQTKQWRKRADMRYARAHHNVTVMDERIFVFGGRDSNGEILAAVEMYEPEMDQWTTLASIPEPMMGSAIANNEGIIYVIGGVTTNKEKKPEGNLSNKIFCFDPLNNKWYRKPSLSSPRAFSAATTQNKKIWIWGGANLSEEGLLSSIDSIDVLDPKKGTLEHHMNFELAKHCHAVAKTGAHVFIVGGMSSVEASAIAETEMYDRKRNIIQRCSLLPVALTGIAVAAIPADTGGEYYEVPTSTPSSKAKPQPGSKPTSVKYKKQPDIHERNEAAKKVQRRWRRYIEQKSITKRMQQGDSSGSTMLEGNDRISGRIRTYISGYRPLPPDQDDLSKELVPVSIPFWPPDPDTTDSVFHTVRDQYRNPEEQMGFKHFYTIPRQMDPNLGMLLFMDEDYQHSKKVLGLRSVESVPYYINRFQASGTIQDNTIPVIIGTGGVDLRDPMNIAYGRSVFQYHPLKDRWEFFGYMPQPRNYHAAAYYRSAIYITGGYDPDVRTWGEMVATKTTFVYELASKNWTRMGDMRCARSHHSLLVFNDVLYAIGGRDDIGRLVSSVESYDHESNEWTMEKSMPSPRMGMAAVAHGGYIWLLGGLTSMTTEEPPVLDDVLCYDPVFKHWVDGRPLRIGRAFGNAAVCDNKIWLCGGAAPSTDENNYLVSVPAIDVYDEETMEWKQKTSLGCPRHSAIVVALESCLYIAGGVNSHELSATSRNELYMVDNDTIQTVRELPIPLTGMAAVTIPPKCVTFRSESLSIMIRHKVTP
ncbi:alpha-scruin [Limulus polyphemus]|uniref:Alpha-scruin n=1 Tax=Limulus polyphemus TaxID=6850 RepID=SCRA_LIMPO|nr:alpha-scruin [Limulus polyphemus]Q25390.1 RecName: Full=Alpha-scruin [Limulus polyphemus]CAA86292.1 scruin [Limulus polyphemus]prf//2103269A scrulin [Limulus sp.]